MSIVKYSGSCFLIEDIRSTFISFTVRCLYVCIQNVENQGQIIKIKI